MVAAWTSLFDLLSSRLSVITPRPIAEVSAMSRARRATLHDGMRADATAAMEAITGREVAAYLTAQQHDPDLAVLAFHFGPSAGVQGHG